MLGLLLLDWEGAESTLGCPCIVAVDVSEVIAGEEKTKEPPTRVARFCAIKSSRLSSLLFRDLGPSSSDLFDSLELELISPDELESHLLLLPLPPLLLVLVDTVIT